MFDFQVLSIESQNPSDNKNKDKDSLDPPPEFLSLPVSNCFYLRIKI